MTDFSIFIPSKGRAELASTPKLLTDVGLPFSMVVEPQECQAYTKAQPSPQKKIITLPENNKGLAYSRQFIIDYAKRNRIRYFAMLDDDIKEFGIVRGGRCIVTDAKVLSLAANMLAARGFAQMGLCYRQNARFGKRDFHYPCHCDCVVFFDSFQLAGIRYDPYIYCKEDWDLSMQIAARGLTPAICNRLFFSVPRVGSNSGGLNEVYLQGKNNIGAIRLRDKWGADVVKVKNTNRNGWEALECEVKWRELKGRIR